jgi:hypothetical protein
MCSNVPIVVEKNLQKGINQGSLKNVDFHFMLFFLMVLLISTGEDFVVKNNLLVNPYSLTWKGGDFISDFYQVNPSRECAVPLRFQSQELTREKKKI